MPQLINRVPPGLLSLLGIKGTGQNPVLLADELVTTLNTTEAYYAAVSQPYQDVVTTPGTVGFFGGTISSPPAGELWVFPNVQCAFGAPLAAGTTSKVRLAVAQLGSAEILHASPGVCEGTVASRPLGPDSGPLYVRPGETLGVWVESLTLGTAASVAIFGRRVVLTL
jgi:hypothetical protein